METQITEMVRNGISPMQKRRELIKYLSLFSASPSFSQMALRLGDPDAVSDARQRLKIEIAKTAASNAPREMKIEIAETYEKLGDYKRSAREYAEIVKGYPGDGLLYSLATQYERLGEKATALQIYEFMGEAFPSNSMGTEISMRGIACLNGTTNSYRFLKKPDWWSAYENLPDWWTNVSMALPKITCFDDGADFIVHNLWKKDDPRKAVKAWAQLSEFTPTTFNEDVRAIRSTSLAYSEIGDHHRAIETEWKILEKYPGDEWSAGTLKFIASEFEKLGESNQVQEIETLAQ